MYKFSQYYFKHWYILHLPMSGSGVLKHRHTVCRSSSRTPEGSIKSLQSRSWGFPGLSGSPLARTPAPRSPLPSQAAREFMLKVNNVVHTSNSWFTTDQVIYLDFILKIQGTLFTESFSVYFTYNNLNLPFFMKMLEKKPNQLNIISLH